MKSRRSTSFLPLIRRMKISMDVVLECQGCVISP
jgi:hypothetical protein